MGIVCQTESGGVMPDAGPALGPHVAAGGGLAISFASAGQREAIYRMRHATYAAELGQHAVNEAGRLTDPLDTLDRRAHV